MHDIYMYAHIHAFIYHTCIHIIIQAYILHAYLYTEKTTHAFEHTKKERKERETETKEKKKKTHNKMYS